MKTDVRQILTDTANKYINDFNYFKNVLWKPLMLVEGGAKLHNVAGDSGGWTVFGVSYNNNKNYFTSLEDFKKLTESDAQLIGFSKYYITAGTQFVAQDAKDMYFDISFNMGQSRAIKLAQKCLGLTQDGIIGPMTRAKLASLTETCLTKERTSFYYSLVKLKKFLKGWLNRVSIISKID
jgi:lysozyme family protein